MKKFLVVFFIFFAFLFKVDASEYKDVVAPLLDLKKSDKVTIYLFHSNSCQHCRNEMQFLKEYKEEMKDKINVVTFELSSMENGLKYEKVADYFYDKSNSIPFTVIGENYKVGFSETIKEDIKNIVNAYLNNEEVGTKTKLPFIGEVDLKEISIPLVAVVLGFIDGFNPCAMWILLFLISMLFNMKDKKKMWALGITFLLTSAFVYFLAMVGLNIILGITAVTWIKVLIGLVAITGGIINIKSYIDTKDGGCHVVDSNKRKKYFTKINKIINEKNFILSLVGIIALAASVNVVELACSAGFPTLFIEILNINNVSFMKEILYILLYILFYLMDDLVIFIIAMLTLQLTGISTKYNRISHLVGGILMIIMGLLLIFKPEILMFNF